MGPITVRRRYYASRHCPCKAVPWDQWAGMTPGHRLSPQARRLATLVGCDHSFDKAARKLEELCHLKISNDVVRAVCNEEGQQARQWLQQAPASAAPMAQASGELEFYSDGVQVNTIQGWRELRVSVFAKRPATQAAEPAQWKQRVLETPSCRVAWAAIAACHVVGASWRRMMEHLKLLDTPQLSVLGDGARWIWDQAARRFRFIQNVSWTVDVYHVSEHVHACAQKMFGLHTPQARQWSGQRVEELIALEGPSFIQRLRQMQQAATDAAAAEALAALVRYLSDNSDSLWYRTRLAQGLPIGSGLVEGTCKNMIGERLKKNSPRWRVRRAENMAALRCLHYSELWESYWQSKGTPNIAA